MNKLFLRRPVFVKRTHEVTLREAPAEGADQERRSPPNLDRERVGTSLFGVAGILQRAEAAARPPVDGAASGAVAEVLRGAGAEGDLVEGGGAARAGGGLGQEADQDQSGLLQREIAEQPPPGPVRGGVEGPRRPGPRDPAGIPESFNVLVKEMRSLGLNVELHNSKQQRGGGEIAEAAE